MHVLVSRPAYLPEILWTGGTREERPRFRQSGVVIVRPRDEEQGLADVANDVDRS